ncbi:MAG: hypothetical protein ACOC97_02190 [Myxococcota bacterium]
MPWSLTVPAWVIGVLGALVVVGALGTLLRRTAISSRSRRPH